MFLYRNLISYFSADSKINKNIYLVYKFLILKFQQSGKTLNVSYELIVEGTATITVTVTMTVKMPVTVTKIVAVTVIVTMIVAVN